MSTLGEFLDKSLPKKEPLVEGLIYLRDNCTLVGRRRHGKTTLVSNLVLALTMPKPDFLGYPIPAPRRAAIFYLEDDPSELQEKLKQQKGNGDTADRLHLFTKEDVFAASARTSAADPKFRRYVEEKCAEAQPDLIVFDNLSHLLEGDYNNARRVHELVTFAYQLNKQFNAAVLFLAHPRKQSAEFKVRLTDDPEQFFEEVLGSSHSINSTGTLWGLQRGDDVTCFVGGAQRYMGTQCATALEYNKDTGWFEAQDNFTLNLPLVVNTEKRRNAWAAFPGAFTYSEARNAAKPYLKSEGSFTPFWKELKQKKLILSSNGEHHQKADNASFATGFGRCEAQNER
jgi:AAA domain